MKVTYRLQSLLMDHKVGHRLQILLIDFKRLQSLPIDYKRLQKLDIDYKDLLIHMTTVIGIHLLGLFSDYKSFVVSASFITEV
jgi:hypothetical protein